MSYIVKLDNSILISFSNLDENLSYKNNGDSTYIYSNQTLVGLNILNNLEKYINYFDLKNKFTTIDQNIKNKLGLLDNAFNNELIYKSYFLKGKIIENIKHPKSDHLQILTIQSNKVYTIITNRLELKKDDVIAFATHWSYLLDGTKISLSKIMGIESQGMVLTYKTLHINNVKDFMSKNLTKNFEILL